MSKVLLIEDDPIVRKVYSSYLENKGHEVKTVVEGSKAIETALQFNPDVVLLDLMMPKLGGAKILEKLRKKEKYTDLPIIVYTNLSGEEKKKEILAKGATEFISKWNSNPKEIASLIEKYLQLE